MGAEVAVSNFLNFRSADFSLDKLFESKNPKRMRGFFSTAIGMILHAHEADNRSRTSTALADPASHKVALAHPVPVIGGIMQSDLPSTLTEQIAPAQPVSLTSAEQDRLLVQAALRGDQTAFAELVTRYQSAVYNMASRMLGDPTEAEDAAQEVFVRAWIQLRTFQQDRRFSTWLLSIASHHCIDVLRRRKPSAPLDGVALYVESDEPEPDEIVLQDEQRDMMQSLINALPEKYRAVTLLRYYGDMSYDEISQATGLTESAVKTQLHRARKMLAGQLLKQQTQELGPVDAASLRVPEE